jgi:hypothetical protein
VQNHNGELAGLMLQGIIICPHRSLTEQISGSAMRA